MPFLFMHDENTRIPAGTITMWSGRIGSIPAGWAFCDGTNGTPDLRNKFIVGGKEDLGGVMASDITGTLKSSGGQVSHYHYIDDSYGHEHGTYNYTVDVAYGDEEMAQAGGMYVDNEMIYLDCWGEDNIPPFFALAYIMKL